MSSGAGSCHREAFYTASSMLKGQVNLLTEKRTDDCSTVDSLASQTASSPPVLHTDVINWYEGYAMAPVCVLDFAIKRDFVGFQDLD